MTFGSSWSSNGSQRAAQRCGLELVAGDRQQVVHAQPAAALRSLGWHHANTPLLVNGPPITLAAPNSVLRAARATGSGLRNAGAGVHRPLEQASPRLEVVAAVDHDRQPARDQRRAR